VGARTEGLLLFFKGKASLEVETAPSGPGEASRLMVVAER
tara:strand:- start:434 stop:553 length:120 start_codon:yes stop_codon:yes gene_type:complete